MTSRISALVAALALAALIVGGPRLAGAAQMVVISASGSDLQPGQMVDGAKTLELPEGAKVTLIGQDGTPVRLVGPFSGAPGASGGGSGGGAGVVTALAKLIASGEGQSSIGATRGIEVGDEITAIPDPWAIPVARAGTYCVRDNGPTYLWRLDAGASETVVLSRADGTWSGRQPWPAGRDRIGLPPNFPPEAKADFVVLRSGGTRTELTLRRVPGSLGKDALRAAWMASVGCDLQARTLIKSMK